MQISELAARTGVSVHALRHYEKLGLLLPARRPSGYRDYTEAMRREVVFIAMSRRIGFSLKDIAAQLPAYRSGRLSFEEMLQAMQTRVADIDAQIVKLKTQRRAVVDHIAWMKKRQREHLAKKAAQTSTPRKPPWPVVSPSLKRIAP
jgi:MerR family copper efflux transcriptional regulator